MPRPTHPYCPTGAGFLFLAIVLDACSRKVVGWSMENHLKTELVLAAINMALAQRRPQEGIIHHSDHGTQYTSFAFGKRCREMDEFPVHIAHPQSALILGANART